MIEAISFISSSLNPREVTAGVPRRTPDVTNGFSVSYGIVFLFTVIPTSSSTCSATLPVKPKIRLIVISGCLYHQIRFQRLLLVSFLLMLLHLLLICFAYSLNSGCNASPNATAFAAITCINGPP